MFWSLCSPRFFNSPAIAYCFECSLLTISESDYSLDETNYFITSLHIVSLSAPRPSITSLPVEVLLGSLNWGLLEDRGEGLGLPLVLVVPNPVPLSLSRSLQSVAQMRCPGCARIKLLTKKLGTNVTQPQFASLPSSLLHSFIPHCHSVLDLSSFQLHLLLNF